MLAQALPTVPFTRYQWEIFYPSLLLQLQQFHCETQVFKEKSSQPVLQAARYPNTSPSRMIQVCCSNRKAPDINLSLKHSFY